MSKKKKVKLSESESTAFKHFLEKTDEEYKKANDQYSKNPSKNRTYDEMAFFNRAMLKFMKENVSQIRYVGRGSSRYVYALSDGTALKVAKSRSGIAQNKQEAKTCMNSMMKYAIFPDFYGADTKNWLALNCELCAKAEEKDFIETLSAKPTQIVNSIRYIVNTFKSSDQVNIDKVIKHFNNRDDVSENFAKSLKNRKSQAVKAIWSLIDFYMTNGLDEMIPDDLTDISNWGISVRNNEKVLVVIDAGFSDSVWQEHYS